MPIKTNLTSMAPSREQFKREIVLLSKGFSSPTKLPGGKITVYPWDQDVDDWVIKSVRKLNPGKIPFEILKRVTGFDNVDDFTVGDATTVILVARSLARASTISYTAVCPECGTEEPATISIPDQLEKVAEKPDNYPGWDEIILPTSKDVIRIRPILVRDAVFIIDRTEASRSKISDRLAKDVAALVSVNGGLPENPDEAVTYFKALHPQDLKFYRDSTENLSPHLGTSIAHKCDSCGCEFKHDLNLESSFFR